MSDDRLEPRTALASLTALAPRLEQATPRSCLAVRFARSHAEGGERVPLTSCELCGQLPGVSTCEPLLVGGQVIGNPTGDAFFAVTTDSTGRIIAAGQRGTNLLLERFTSKGVLDRHFGTRGGGAGQ